MPGPPIKLPNLPNDAGDDRAGVTPLIKLVPGTRRPSARPLPSGSAVAAMLVAAALALAPLFSGYYSFNLWGPLGIGAIVLLVVLCLTARPVLTRSGLSAGTGLGVLLALSACSMLWAESRDSAWTDSNRLALYCVIFAIGILAVRERRSARTVLLLLGAPALVSSIVLCLQFLTGSGQGAFLTSRLNSPIGYINGTAGLLSMGLWPWIALAESGGKRWVRVGGIVGASLIGGTVVLTQSRAIVPATLVAAIFVLVAAPRRTRRATCLLIILGSVAVSLHWTLAIYQHTGLLGGAAPPAAGALRSVGLALLAGAILAGVAWLLITELAERMPPRQRTRTARTLGRSLLAITCALTVVGVAVGGHTISTQWKAFTSLQVNQSASTRFLDAGGFRYDLWRVAVDEFKSHPLGGVGAGNYDTEYYRLRHNPEYVVQPHSLELQMAAELGIGGIVGLVLLIGGVLWAGLARTGTLASEDPMIKVAAAGVFVAWLAATSVDWLYDIPGLAGAAFLACAMLVLPARRAQTTMPKEPPRASRGRNIRPQIALVAALAILALITASIGRQYAADRYAISGADQTARSPERALRTLETAESLDPYSLTTLYSIASAYANLDDYADARASILAAQKLEPHDYVPPALLGDLASRRGDFQVAVVEYRRALRLNPIEPELQSDLAGAKIRAR